MTADFDDSSQKGFFLQADNCDNNLATSDGIFVYLAERVGIVVFGGGTPTGNFGNSLVQVASTGRLSLNNSGGEVITLLDLKSVVVDIYSYSSADDDQSITRDPDITGPDPMVNHSEVTGANGTLFSPGTKVDGSLFADSPSSVLVKTSPRTWRP